MAFILVVGGMLVVGLLLIIHGTVFKTRWGINAGDTFECPSCHKIHSQIRAPRNFRQALWGGFTCDQCGLEADKWNRPISN
jgi:hypothetical protein